MFKYFKELLSDELTTSTEEGQSKQIDTDRKLQIATCALMIEVANSDDNFSSDEKEEIYLLMKNTFDLTNNEIDNLLRQSEEAVNESISLYEFTDIINKSFDPDHKYEIIKNLWRLIFADEKLHSHEEYFIRKISNNLHLEHRDFIAAKLEVKKEMNI